MKGRHLAWAVSLPLMVLSWLVAHSLAYRLVAPHGETALHVLEHAAHSYPAYASVVLVLCVGLVVAGFAAAVVVSIRGNSGSAGPRAALGLVPPLGFAIQEHLERWLHAGSFPVGVALEPVFLVGLLLESGFALVALLAAGALLRMGAWLGEALRVGWRPRPCAVQLSPRSLPLAPPDPPRPAVLAADHGPRGPPLVAVAR